MRKDRRENDALRPIALERGYTRYAEGAVLVSFGETRVICTATVEDKVPPFLRDRNTGWVTAEYNMLPRSSRERIPREASRKGRALEISRLIGRSLRCITDLDALGARQITLDCDVLQADGGTRTASITGAYVALYDALALMVSEEKLRRIPLIGQCAAVSVGLVEGEPMLDLCYEEDFAADVDMNVVMRSDGAFIEVQGSAEGEAFPRKDMDRLLDLAEKGILELFIAQKAALGIG